MRGMKSGVTSLTLHKSLVAPDHGAGMTKPSRLKTETPLGHVCDPARIPNGNQRGVIKLKTFCQSFSS